MDDNWKVSRRLSLNIGVRYSYFPPAHESSDKYRVVRPANYNPAKAVTLNAQGQIIKNSGDLFNGLVNPADYRDFPKKNFAPRMSFAWDILGDGKTAVRGGFGMFYSREILGAFILMSGNPPFAKLVDLFNTSLSNPGGGSARDLPTTLGSIDTKQQTPYPTATHLLRSGVDINTVRAWLGHVSLNTTNIYAEIDLAMKAKALAKCEIPDQTGSKKPWRQARI